MKSVLKIFLKACIFVCVCRNEKGEKEKSLYLCSLDISPSYFAFITFSLKLSGCKY